MKKQILIFILILSILFILVACKSSPKVSSTSFIGGKEGVSASLAIESTAGGNKIFDGGVDPFKIDVTLQNLGEHEVAENEALITLDGINFNAYQIRDPTQKNTVPLSKKRKEAGRVTTPAQTIVQYDANYKPDEDADRTVNFAANICYKYKTTSRVQDLCLRKRITGPSGNATCNVEETKGVENSGAPFQVKTFSERPAGENKIVIWIEAQNEGKGSLYTKDYLSNGKCIESDAAKNKVYVKVELTEFENSPNLISCSGLNKNEGFVNVIQNKIQLSCNIETASFQETTFETPLRLTFDYVYKDSVSTTLTIKSSI